MDVHLIDGTYELFRHFYAVPSTRDKEGHRGSRSSKAFCWSVLGRMIQGGATHVAVATDQIIESFRNDLWPGYKTGQGIDPNLWATVSPAGRSPHGSRYNGMANGGI